MPSPIGHALAGLAAGWLVEPPRASPAAARERWTSGLVFAAAGVLPDVDLVFGAHSGPTHGLGAACLAGLAAFLITRRPRLSSAVAAAYASHVLLDWLGTDTSPPIGIMALWPFSRGYYESHIHIFMAISRRYWLPEFWSGNLRALVRELLILVPVTLAVALLTRARRGGVRGRGPDANVTLRSTPPR
jgi:hypothetical protein